MIKNEVLRRQRTVINLFTKEVFGSIEAAAVSVGGTRSGLYQAFKRGNRLYRGMPFEYYKRDLPALTSQHF